MGSGIFGLDVSEADAGVVLVPVPWEATTSYGGGTAKGPEAILAASHQLDYFDVDVGTPYEAGIHMIPVSSRATALNRAAKPWAQLVIDPGDATPEQLRDAREAVNRASGELNTYVHSAALERIRRGKLVGVVGGDHSVAFGAIAAHAESYGPIGVLQFDAHADLRKAYHGFSYSHASVMRAVLDEIPGVASLVQIGIRDLCPEESALIRSNERIATHFDRELARARMKGQLAQLLDQIAEALPERLYVSFDIDGLDPKLCPHTGTPVPGGLELAEVSYLLDAVVSRGKVIVGFDLNEVAPGPDGDEWDGNVGARLLYKLIGFAVRSRA